MRSLAIDRLLALSVLLALSAAASPALAYGSGSSVVSNLGLPDFTILSVQVTKKKKAPLPSSTKAKEEPTSYPSGGGTHAPELDPSAAGAAALLLLGGTLVATGRRRREKCG